MITAEEIIRKLDLAPLPYEGGFYRQTYRSLNQVSTVGDAGFKKIRQAGTAIYYLVTPDAFSAFHRVKSDEVFHFYGGDSVEMVQIDQDRKLSRIIFGKNILTENQQIAVPSNVWQAIRLQGSGLWALMGATVAPGFEFEDFELGNREAMLLEFPEYRKDILRFTRGTNKTIR